MSTPLTIDRGLLDYCTPRQREVLEAIDKHGSAKAAAISLGISWQVPSQTHQFVKAKAAKQGYAPDHDMKKPVPPGFNVKGVSTYYNRDGKPTGQWVKSTADQDARYQAMLAEIDRRCGDVTPRPRVEIDADVSPNSELCNLITMTDCHVGALAWDREAGEDWDLAIARETLTRVFVGLIRALPAAGTCVINQLGDFLHTDGLAPITPGHGNVLDADSRFQKMSEVAVDILEDIISEALAKHDRVHIIMAEGNHDESSSVWLRVMFKRLFRDNPRVTVEDCPLPYYVFQHGQVMLAFHHGHKLKPADLPGWFAAKHAVMWGATTARYGHSGHQHHLHEKDEMGMRWMQHPTIAASDAYSARGGWLSPREAIGITYDLKGETLRLYARPQMFRDMEREA